MAYLFTNQKTSNMINEDHIIKFENSKEKKSHINKHCNEILTSDKKVIRQTPLFNLDNRLQKSSSKNIIIDLVRYMNIHNGDQQILKMWGKKRYQNIDILHNIICKENICAIDVETVTTPPGLVQIATGKYIFLFKPVYDINNVIYTNKHIAYKKLKLNMNKHKIIAQNSITTTNLQSYTPRNNTGKKKVLQEKVDPMITHIIQDCKIVKFFFDGKNDLNQLNIKEKITNLNIIDVRYEMGLPLHKLNLAKAYITYVHNVNYPSYITIKKKNIGHLFNHINNITDISKTMFDYAAADAWATLQIGKRYLQNITH